MSSNAGMLVLVAKQVAEALHDDSMRILLGYIETLLKFQGLTKVGILLSEYVTQLAISKMMTKQSCHKCADLIRMVGLNPPTGVDAKCICKTALKCAYTEVLHNPISAVKEVNGMLNSVLALANLPVNTAEFAEKHKELAEEIKKKGAKIEDIWAKGVEVYGKDHAHWLHVGLPTILHGAGKLGDLTVEKLHGLIGTVYTDVSQFYKEGKEVLEAHAESERRKHHHHHHATGHSDKDASDDEEGSDDTAKHTKSTKKEP